MDRQTQELLLQYSRALADSQMPQNPSAELTGLNFLLRDLDEFRVYIHSGNYGMLGSKLMAFYKQELRDERVELEDVMLVNNYVLRNTSARMIEYAQRAVNRLNSRIEKLVKENPGLVDEIRDFLIH